MQVAFDSEDWYPELEKEIDAIFEECGFGYTDPDVIEAEVAKFREYLESTPSAER